MDLRQILRQNGLEAILRENGLEANIEKEWT